MAKVNAIRFETIGKRRANEIAARHHVRIRRLIQSIREGFRRPYLQDRVISPSFIFHGPPNGVVWTRAGQSTELPRSAGKRQRQSFVGRFVSRLPASSDFLTEPFSVTGAAFALAT